MFCPFISNVWDVIWCSDNLKDHWPIFRNKFTIDHRQSEESHWPFGSSYRVSLVVIEDNMLFREIMDVYFTQFTHFLSSYTTTHPIYNQQTIYQLLSCIFSQVKSILVHDTILWRHGWTSWKVWIILWLFTAWLLSWSVSSWFDCIRFAITLKWLFVQVQNHKV